MTVDYREDYEDDIGEDQLWTFPMPLALFEDHIHLINNKTVDLILPGVCRVVRIESGYPVTYWTGSYLNGDGQRRKELVPVQSFGESEAKRRATDFVMNAMRRSFAAST